VHDYSLDFTAWIHGVVPASTVPLGMVVEIFVRKILLTLDKPGGRSVGFTGATNPVEMSEQCPPYERRPERWST
jgi:hypothetical protein